MSLHWSPFQKKKLVIFKIYMMGKETEIEKMVQREISLLPILSKWLWQFRLDQAQESIQVSHVGDKKPTTWAIFCCLLKYILSSGLKWVLRWALSPRTSIRKVTVPNSILTALPNAQPWTALYDVGIYRHKLASEHCLGCILWVSICDVLICFHIKAFFGFPGNIIFCPLVNLQNI